jgi:CBS domain-containing protein
MPGAAPQQSQAIGPAPQSAGAQQQVPPGAPTQQVPQPRPQAAQRRSLLKPVTVDDVVSENVVSVERDTPIRTTVAKMSDRDVGSVVVVDDRQPIGVLTDRKIALALEERPDVADRPAEELIGRDLITVDASTTIFEALQLMSDEGIRRLPIADEDGRLRGIVTLDDALVLLANELDKLATTVREQSPRL